MISFLGFCIFLFLTHASTFQEPLVLVVEDAKDFVSESRRDLDATSDTTCHICPSGTIQYPGTHRCFERKWSGFLCNLDPATDPAKHHANDRKCVCSGSGRRSLTGRLMDMNLKVEN